MVCALAVIAVLGNGAGVVGYSGLQPGQSCNACHTGGGAPTVTLTGPSTLGAGSTANYTVTVTGGSANRAGVNVAVSSSFARLNPVSGNLGLAFGELYQLAPVAFSGGGASMQFSLTAPAFAASLNLHAAGISCNGDGSVGGDRSTTTTLAITVPAGSGTLPPQITAPAALALSPVRARSVQVTVDAQDDGGPTNLSFTWAATGPSPVTFTPNGSNAAKSSLATFTRAGAYQLTVTVTDGTNRSTTSSVAADVQAAYAALRVHPVSVQVAPSAKQVFTATALDQFEASLSPQPTVTWSVPFGGSVAPATGAQTTFTAQNGPGGPFTITAFASSIGGSATIGVGQPPPSLADSKPPVVSLLRPSPQSKLEAGLLLEAQANDNTPPNDTGVAEVTFEVAGITIATVTQPPWVATYAPSKPLPAGSQALAATAKDRAGNVAHSSAVPVEVPASAGQDGGEGQDAGVDGGTRGGGVPPRGCGCASSGPWEALGLLALARRRRTRPSGR